jgi:UDP-glucuronate 4-epimerase
VKTLVTGVAGFIGSTLARRLLADGHDVVGVDSLTDYYDPRLKRENLRDIEHPRLRVVEADLNALDLGALLADVEVIYHQAGQPGVRRSWGSDFDAYAQDNVCATQKLLEAAQRASRLTRFVYASSSSVYGNALRYPTQESDRPQPLSPYGVTKLAAEHLCTLYAENYGLPTVSLRYFTVYGPRQRPDMAFTSFCTAVRDGAEIAVFGTGDQVRDFTYVDDVVEANLRVAAGEITKGSVFNVAGGTSTTVNEVIDLLGEISGTVPKVNRGAPVPGDVLRTGGSTRAIEAATGWSPAVALRDGLEEQYRWAATVLT